MSLQLSKLDAKLRARIERQLAAEDAASMGSRKTQGTEPDGRSAGQDRGVESAARGVGFRVVLIQCRRRLLDEHDSMRFAVKPLVDAITSWLGFAHDNDPRLRWEYGQCQTQGEEGTIVKVEEMKG